jgi:CDP-6-deoxy-D-xylo-4-hexulose-3-dehydrase
MIRLIKSTFYHEAKTQKQLASFVKNAKWLSFGSQAERFEQALAKYQDRQELVMVNSGSSANLALIQACLNLNLVKRGQMVGFSAVTWSTNVMPIIQLGLIPVPIDVELETLNVSSAQLIKVLEKYPIKMLFLTHLLGLCDDLEQIVKICRKKHIVLIEDTCEALGSVYRGKKLGNFGLASSFSFYVGHHLSTIEGGAVATDNAELAQMLRIVRAHGWDRNLSKRQQRQIRGGNNKNSAFYSRYTFYDLGYNFRPTEIAGYLGRVQLPYLPEIVHKREANFKYLADKLYCYTDRFLPYSWDKMDILSNFAVPLIARTIKIKQRLVVASDKKIELRPIVGGNVAEQPFFKKYHKGNIPETPNARFIHHHGFYMGNNPEMTKKELDIIVRVLTKTPVS